MAFEHGLSPARKASPGSSLGAGRLGRGLTLMVGLGLASAATAAPWQLDVHVAGAVGGRIDGLPDGGSCGADCVAAVRRPALVGLLAEPDPGFRFAGWQGACEATLGPLCTLPVSADASVGVRFIRETEPDPALDGVLLLHDDGETPALWNRVVDRQFDGRCPVVYGGVPLGRAPDLPPDSLHCYRVRFGYYAALRGADSESESGQPASLPQWQSEIRAAVAGIMDARPRLRLVLVGKGRAVAAAQRFLEAPTPERAVVGGVLSVVAPASALADPPTTAPEVPEVGEQGIAAQAWALLRSR
ncbi:hypothetical protein [Methylomagnum sp.]